MKIATWNIERLKHRRDLAQILQACETPQADILVLTESDVQVRPNYRNCFHTRRTAEIQPESYRSTETRVSIYTNYDCIRLHDTYDNYTSECAELETELGPLLVYGTVIGVYGNRHPSFRADLSRQLDDLRRLAETGLPLCICGDFNLSFADNYYYTKSGRTALLQFFEDHEIELLTKGQPECIDHIAISKQIVADADIHIAEWNLDKRLSDHKGISASLSFGRGYI